MNVAQQIHDYIKDRAAVEGVGFELPVEFFEQSVELGAMPIFGVEYDENGITVDNQEPEDGYLEQWLENHEQTQPDE